MKRYLYIILFGVIVSIIGLIFHQRGEIRKYMSLYDKELQNVEAYRISNSGLEGSVREYQMTMDDLRASQDLLDKKLADAIDELKIKDKAIQSLQYQLSNASRTDTIQITDTIFVPEVNLDTLVGDKWYSLRLQLSYPSTIVASPNFVSEKYIVINSRKEYNKPPSKIFFIRWFQRKHNVVEVNVEEKNPYIEIKQQKFIKILK